MDNLPFCDPAEDDFIPHDYAANSSLRIAHSYVNSWSDMKPIDFIGYNSVLKNLFMSLLRPKDGLSFAIHNVDGAILVDEFNPKCEKVVQQLKAKSLFSRHSQHTSPDLPTSNQRLALDHKQSETSQRSRSTHWIDGRQSITSTNCLTPTDYSCLPVELAPKELHLQRSRQIKRDCLPSCEPSTYGPESQTALTTDVRVNANSHSLHNLALLPVSHLHTKLLRAVQNQIQQMQENPCTYISEESKNHQETPIAQHINTCTNLPIGIEEDTVLSNLVDQTNDVLSLQSSKRTHEHLWTFHDIRSVIKSDLAIFGDLERPVPAISVKLREDGKPINVLTGMDLWLDNLMCNVPEVMMCYHMVCK